ncbi:HNH endonuclease signature motif containing protein [Oceanicella sp. SM1341]|uniref:HNH endonuclease signature motif containing protein n=1 Tax=Oceanicella sp. SM1341 TaxID=1548889 RepID=UPI000E471518|nr:HNH endonuclease signature motif containing protein [Oceanicella sp. SM1341]
MLRKICSAPGCQSLAAEGSARCAEHTRTDTSAEQHRKARADQARRGMAGREWYGTARWKRARLGFLAVHPLCAECQSLGLVEAATEVDHVTPHRGDAALFWDPRNWQGLCRPCHSRKTAREVGFAGPRR